jgi:ATP-dependent helicase/nuclease subunit B
MSVRFILGRAGTGKTRMCLDAVAAALRRPEDTPLVLLVPEQATHQAEQAILSEPGIEGFSRLRIVSFERLRFWLMPPAAGRAELSRVGRRMIAGRILMDCRDRLKILAPGSSVAGLAEKTADLIAELFHADMTPDQLRQTAELLEKQEPGSRTALKLADLAVIFEAYQDYLDSRRQFSDPDRDFSCARRRVGQAAFLRGALLWVDGFSGFTAQEEALLMELLRAAGRSHIALCLDPSAAEADSFDPFSAFAPTENTYLRLQKRIADAKLKIEKPILLKDSRRFHRAPALRYLEENFFDEFPSHPVPCGGAVISAALPDLRGECLWVARQILRLVRDENLRYREIAVVVPEMDSYQHPLVWALERMGLPFFLDRPRPLRTHPAVELLDSALRAVCFNFRLPDMMTYLKTGLTGLADTDADLLDNYCRACGIEGEDWFTQSPWNFADPAEGFDQAKINALRRRIAEPLGILRRALRIGKEQPIETREFVGAVWEFLESLQIRRALSELAKNDPSDQQFGHRQLWDKLVQMFDELCAIYEDTQRPAEEYVRLLQSAFASMAIKLIPPALDQVLVGQIERSRHPDIRVLFLLGLTQNQFPVPLANDGLLGRDDRAAIEPVLPDLAETLQEQLVRRRYLSYIALTRAAQKVFLTRPITDENGSPIQPWAGLEKLHALFSDLCTINPSPYPQRPDELQTSSEWLGWFCDTLGRDSQADPTTRQTAAALLDLADPQIASPVRAAVAYDNQARLEPDLLPRIFTGPLTTSVSRLETFAACPYQHFGAYILRLKKRRLVRLEPMDFGSFYHAVLDALFKTIRQKGKDWRSLPGEQLDKIVLQVVEQTIQNSPPLQSYRRHSSHQAFILSDAADQVRRLAAALKEMIGAGTFTPVQTEIPFGKDGGLPALELALPNNGTIRLRGVIDRIDCADMYGRSAALIFDYKSTSRPFRWVKWKHGLDLQMPAYLLALRGRSVEGKILKEVVGAFYLPVRNYPKLLALSEYDKEIKFAYKARGFFNGQYADALDTAPGRWSTYYNFGINKEGSPYSNFNISGALNPEQFSQLLSETQKILCSLASRILSGEIGITPYRLNRISPCTSCDYRAVCKFDWQINTWRPIPSLDKQAVLDTLKEGTQ